MKQTRLGGSTPRGKPRGIIKITKSRNTQTEKSETAEVFRTAAILLRIQL
jgi:hypothetical protein